LRSVAVFGTNSVVEAILRYRGREVTAADVSLIQDLIASHPEASRRRLSEKLCAAWNWVQPNGAPRTMVCRGLMLALARAGHIELPAVRRVTLNPLARRARPQPVEVDQTPLYASLSSLTPLTFRSVRRTEEERLFNGLVETHHYLGYTQPVGEHLKIIVYAEERPVACFAWSSAPRHLGPRDRYLGWSAAERRRNIRLVAYNSRYLILPWIHVEHLASHLLGRMVRMLPGEWEKVYGHPVYFAETFVDSERFRGTCYRAANWVPLGYTTGRGKNDQTHRANRPLKEVLGYPLRKDFRKRILEN
jgi:hypothetical protein